MKRRHSVANEEWARIEPLLPARGRMGRPGKDARELIDAMLWVFKTGAPWRDLPEHYGPYEAAVDYGLRLKSSSLYDTEFMYQQMKLDELQSFLTAAMLENARYRSGMGAGEIGEAEEEKLPKKPPEKPREVQQVEGGSGSLRTESGTGDATSNLTKQVDTYDLVPSQNLSMGKNKFNKFVEEIKANGILEPIKYVEYNGQKYVVDGHHRLQAAKILEIKEVPAQEVQLPYAGYKTSEDLLNWGN